MKKQLFIGLLAATMGLSSCSNWLDVEPKSIIEESELFSSETGFKEALAGVYIQMTNSSLYGRELSYGFLDILAQCYQQKGSNGNYPYQEEGYYEFPSTTTEGKTDAIWKNMYGTIANINNLLYWVDQRTDVFTHENYHDLIKGEALGLRGFLHFDLLRMFGPIYKENKDSYSIVYRSQFNRDTRSLLPATQVVDSIVRDLTEAERLLTDADPLNFEMPASQNDALMMDSETFESYRQKRMNLYAVKATLARVHMYAGNKTEATAYAKEVVESGYFSMVSDNSLDRVYSSEILFSIYVDKLGDQIDVAFTNTGGIYVAESQFLADHFSVSEDGANDIRYRQGVAFTSDAYGYYSQKYNQDGSISYSIQNTIPLIRLSEMYYILAECEEDMGTSASYLSTVRMNRGLESVNYATEEAKEAALDKEWRKEFYAEGQLFYYYKRLGKETFLHCPVSHMTENNYRFSIPDDEVLFGNVPEDENE